MSKRLIITFVLIFIVLFGVFAETSYTNIFYVSSSGNDTTGDGSEGKPYATLKKAYESMPSTDDSAKFVLLSDLTQSKAVIFTGKTIEIDGNSHTINTYGIVGTDKAVITLRNLIIDGTDYEKYQTGTTTASTSSFMHLYDSTMYLESGTKIQNVSCKNKDFGQGAFYVEKDSKVYMKDGAVISNLKANFGALRIISNSEFHMEGGEVKNCGNIQNPYLREGVAFYLNGGHLFISGGKIHSNTNNINNAPGVIFMHSNGNCSLTITGGEITGNKATLGGAVYSASSNNVIKISGLTKIYDNEGSNFQPTKKSSIYLYNGQIIDFDGGLSEGSEVRIYSAANNITDVQIGKNASKNDLKYIKSDNFAGAGMIYSDGTNDYIIGKDGEPEVFRTSTKSAGTIWLSAAAKHTHSYVYSTEGNSIKVYCNSTFMAADCPVFGIENTSQIYFEVPQVKCIDAVIKPANATIKTLSWTSDNPKFVTVANGFVYGLQPTWNHPVTITATSTDGSNVSATCTVTVSMK